jgi:translocation and assembly module TamA
VREERIYYVSTPVSATWDTEDDPLALNSGARLTLAVTPYAGSDSFTRAEWSARSRIRFGPDDRLTLAGRMRAAATFGSPLEELPVNKRVYAGGGSSVRGYDFQAVGPLDPAGVPIGGRSAIEAAIEARARATRTIEIAGFIDAGAVSARSLPEITGDYLAGAGAGVRYLSPIGPIRFDFALPLEKRANDRAVQFYISIGQPF